MKTLHFAATLRLTCFSALVAFATAASAFTVSQAHPNLARGQGSDKTVDSTPWDNVNLFNGNLNLAVPLGVSYPLTDGFEYQFSLAYNSNIWDLTQTTASTSSAQPTDLSNAGLGWDLSFGRLIAPNAAGNQLGKWIYVTPDGSLHPFYSTLHYDLANASTNVFYTRDSSYYRLTANASTTTVEAPDGKISTFQLSSGSTWQLISIADRFKNYLSINYSTPNVWSISDSVGRVSTAYFKADPAALYPAIVDHIVLPAFGGTTATYTFAYTTAVVPRPSIDNDPSTAATVTVPVLTSITMPDGTKRQFTYQTSGDTAGRLASMQLPTLGQIRWGYQSYPFTGGNRATALTPIYRSSVGVATRSLVDASGIMTGSWTYTVALNPSSSGDEQEFTNTVRTPLGHKTIHYFSVNTESVGASWTRGDYALPITKNAADQPAIPSTNVALSSNGGSATASSIANSGYAASGVINGDRSGQHWGDGGGWQDGSTNWWPDALQVSFNGSKTIDTVDVYTLQDNWATAPVEPTSTMTFSKEGIQDFSIQYLSGSNWVNIPGASITGNNLVWRRFKFSPLTTSAIQVTVTKALDMSSRIVEVQALTTSSPTSFPAGSRYLSTQAFDCDANGSYCVLKRTTYLRYEQDTDADPSTYIDVDNTNRRIASSRIAYNDDLVGGVSRYADINQSNFDGLGHYREVDTNGNFVAANVRQVYTAYDATSSQYPSPTFVMMPASNAWVLNTNSMVRVVEGQWAFTTENSFDHDTGFLRRSRRWTTTNLSGAAGSHDAVFEFTPSASGQVAEVQYYGGDVQTLGTGSLDSLSLPPAEYDVRNLFQSGTKIRSQYYDAAGSPFGPTLLDQDVDKNTGLPATTRDSTGLATTYRFDVLGRLLSTRPSQGAWVENVFSAASSGNPSKVEISQQPNGGGAALAYRSVTSDSFGRTSQQAQLMPDGTLSTAATTYDAMGQITSVRDFGETAATQYLSYNSAGMAQIVRPADGSMHDTTYTYTGISAAAMTQSVGAWYDSSSNLVQEKQKTKTKIFDRQGRLSQQILYVDPLLPTTTTQFYSYDAADHLLSITSNGNILGVARSYDGRGFESLVQDSYNHNAYFKNFDALGNALTQRPDWVDLTYDFDRAGRLMDVKDPASGKVWKQYIYSTQNTAGDWSSGKLKTAIRQNYFSDGTSSQVAETYSYGGVDGRVSDYLVVLTDGAHAPLSFETTRGYSVLGDLVHVGYPQGARGVMARNRQANLSYTNGWLASVSDVVNGVPETWLDSIVYSPHGLVMSARHGNGVTDSIMLDSNGIARAGSAYTSGVKNLSGQSDMNLNTGAFQYDGARTLVRAGTDNFVQAGSTPPSYSTITPQTANGCPSSVDVFGVLADAPADGSCAAAARYHRTVSDRILLNENRDANVETWFFRDTDGRLLTEYQAGIVPANDIFLIDSILDNSGSKLSEVQQPGDGSAPTIRNFHSGAGAMGIVTDANGYVVP